jgi:EAL domain-containing protein (putative c-di-GMP-specific phosphodiesterase class I)
VPGDDDDVAIIRAIIAMAHSLGLKVIGEGVETAEQLEFLQKHGCDEFQGFHFCRPIPSEDFSSLLAGRCAPATTPLLRGLPR